MAGKPVRVIPLGGLGEIGRNCMIIEYGDDMIMIDAGLMFPEEEMLGVDLVIPDITYVLQNRRKLRGIFMTHGHEDHIGALPYLLRQIQAPIYATKLTHGLIEVKLKEARLLRETELCMVEPEDEIDIGAFTVEFMRVAHSIPDACGIIVRTPEGTIIHTGDFKIDHTPVMGHYTDLPRLAELGDEGVLLLCSDSTYAEVPGYTPSEQVVGEALDRMIATAPGRVIISTFASLIARIQQVIDAAERHGRKVFVTGRSMIDNVHMAQELGYLKANTGTILRVEEMRRLAPEKLVVVSTGSQGEPTSALVRMANQDHPHIKIVPGDTIIMSSTPIPGNDALVDRVIDNLFKLGARVLYSKVASVHVRGHAAQEELKLILRLVRPRFFMPIHGEYRHLVHHADLATQMGLPRENVFVLEDGDVLELDRDQAYLEERVPASYVYVDGLGVGDVDHVVLRDRWHMATDGTVVVVVTMDKQTGQVVGLPEVVWRGFVDAEESEELLQRTREAVAASLNGGGGQRVDWSMVHGQMKDSVARFLWEQTHRRPMVLPVAVEV
ncbi:MAG TPA: ribonuclease J [Dehalococcoidia bacterium]|nr:ribonuclease J [Dehalococcoidia bacterium]